MTTAETRNVNTSRVLWLSALVLAVVLLVQIGFPESKAIAGRAPSMADVATAGDYTMLTLPTSNEDLLLVLDGRNESLFVYRVKNRSNFELVVPADVKAIFNVGKRIGSGK